MGSQDAEQAWAQLTPVEATAVRVALMRLKGSKTLLRVDGSSYYDSTFDERIVRAVMPPGEEHVIADRPDSTEMADWMAVRTAEIDQQLQLACQPLSHPQVVILGAGMDSRAWRLAWPQHTTVFEVDTGTTEAFKTSVWGGSDPACTRKFVKADLSVQGELSANLQAAGFQPGIPTVWVAEGLIGYLSREAGKQLMDELYALSSPGSRVIMTAPPTEEWRDKLKLRGITLQHTVFESADATLQRLLSTGWQGTLLPCTALAAKYNVPAYHQDFILGHKE